ncbi:MAG: VOC family protein [Acidobacteriota bacterium]|nr:VOC family protein [Acidobacteriota bacterium]
MAKIESYSPGSFCWAELATSDTESAKRLYTGMFNWTVQENPMVQGVYTIFQAGSNAAAGMHGDLPPGVPPHWMVYFSVANVDQSAAKVQTLGGKVVEGPFDVMELGRMAVVQDPEGAWFALWQPKSRIGATHAGPLNQVTWPELSSSDPEGAVAFYSGLFGWKTKPGTGMDAAEYIEWVNEGKNMGGLLPMRGPEWQGVPPHWMIYITVADCDQIAEKAKQLGAAVCVAPTDIPNVGRFSVLTDAQGAFFSVIKLACVQPPASP